jgi:hypothetical protein
VTRKRNIGYGRSKNAVGAMPHWEAPFFAREVMAHAKADTHDDLGCTLFPIFDFKLVMSTGTCVSFHIGCVHVDFLKRTLTRSFL